MEDGPPYTSVTVLPTIERLKTDAVGYNFGADGPYSHRPPFDPIVQSVAAYPSIQVDELGRPNLIATAVCD